MFAAKDAGTSSNGVEGLWITRYSASPGLRQGLLVGAGSVVYNVLVFQGSIDVGGRTLRSRGGGDVVVSKIVADTGAVTWTRQITSNGDMRVGATAVAEDGSVWFGGDFSGELKAGGLSVAAPQARAAFIGRVSADGSITILRDLGADSAVSAVAADGDFGVLVLSTQTSGTEESRVVTLSAQSGAPNELLRVKHRGKLSIGTVAIGPDHSIVLAGNYRGMIECGENREFSGTGTGDAVVIKYDESGAPLWCWTALGGGASSVSIDEAGNLFVLTGTLTTLLGRTVATTSRLSPDGTPIWQSTATSRFIIASEIRILPTGELVVTGAFEGRLTSGELYMDSAGGADIFVATFTAAGELLWLHVFGGSESDLAYDVVATESAIILGGRCGGTFTVGGLRVEDAGERVEDGPGDYCLIAIAP